MLRALRESIRYTQEQFAENLSVDLNTVKGWETGRRPLVNVQARTLFSLRRRLQDLDAPAELLRHLDTAMDVDLFIGDTLEGPHEPSLLASWVSTRTWNELLAWAVADAPPALLRDHLNHVPRSALPMADRQYFFDAIRAQAERALSDRSASPLLRRQVYYMATWDVSPTGSGWLADMESTELRVPRGRGSWTPDWPLLRSISVARARQGDPSLLRDFIARQLSDDICEAANLNYWSYWADEGKGGARTDAFMARDLGRWRGDALLSHLVGGLSEDLPYLDLSIHTICALVQRRPFLLMEDARTARHLRERSRLLLDGHAGVSKQARTELENVHFAAEMAARSTRRDDA